MIDIDKIERAAEAATPGPWRATEKTVTAPETDDRLPLDVRIYGGNKHDSRANARYIAACDPQSILKLIAVVWAAQNLSDVCDSFKATTPIPPSITALREALEALK